MRQLKEQLLSTHLHTKIRVRHAAINSKITKLVPAVLFHRIQDSFGLKASRFECGTRNMTLLRVLSYTDFSHVSYLQDTWSRSYQR